MASCLHTRQSIVIFSFPQTALASAPAHIRSSLMGRNDDNGPALPPKIKAAFDFLHHARMITEQVDASIPMRSLTPLEKSVEAAALRTVQQYLLGEMDFID